MSATDFKEKISAKSEIFSGTLLVLEPLNYQIAGHLCWLALERGSCKKWSGVYGGKLQSLGQNWDEQDSSQKSPIHRLSFILKSLSSSEEVIIKCSELWFGNFSPFI